MGADLVTRAPSCDNERALDAGHLSELLDSIDARNEDNVARTASYLELYRYTVDNPPDLPWVLMAHLVSRNAGYWMTDLARRIEARPEQAPALERLFLLLERANFLIFHDAWFHCVTYLRDGADALPSGRVTRYVREAWSRYAVAPDERALVLDLVVNEQNFIEHRVVRAERFALGMSTIDFIEASGRERPIALPETDAAITVGGFRDIDKRIRTGERIFDEVLADRARRARIFAWAEAHPHTGDASVAGGRASGGLREAWPVARVRSLDVTIHTEPAPDPHWP